MYHCTVTMAIYIIVKIADFMGFFMFFCLSIFMCFLFKYLKIGIMSFPFRESNLFPCLKLQW